MPRISELSNLDVAYAIALVAQLVVASAFLYPFDDTGKVTIGVGLVVVINIFAAIGLAFLRLKVLSADSVWLQTASPNVGAVIVNVVVTVFLCGLVFLVFVMLKARPSAAAASGALVAGLAAAAFGRYWQTRSRTKSLLPYGVTGLVAFFALLAWLFFHKSIEAS
jgi:membrane associated rhomboid family serine protease